MWTSLTPEQKFLSIGSRTMECAVCEQPIGIALEYWSNIKPGKPTLYFHVGCHDDIARDEAVEEIREQAADRADGRD